MRLALPHMKGRAGASVVNIGSISGWSPQLAMSGQYGAAKAALIFDTKRWAFSVIHLTMICTSSGDPNIYPNHSMRAELGVQRNGDGARHDKGDQAKCASSIDGDGGSRSAGATLYRQRRRNDGDCLVDAGLRSGRRHLVQEDRRRLREGQRQHNRLYDRALRPLAPEDRLGGDQRYCPRPVPEQPGRNFGAICLGGQAS